MDHKKKKGSVKCVSELERDEQKKLTTYIGTKNLSGVMSEDLQVVVAPKGYKVIVEQPPANAAESVEREINRLLGDWRYHHLFSIGYGQKLLKNDFPSDIIYVPAALKRKILEQSSPFGTIGKTHDLVCYPGISIAKIMELFSKESAPVFEERCSRQLSSLINIDYIFDPGWFLVRRKPIPGSGNKLFSEQIEMFNGISHNLPSLGLCVYYYFLLFKKHGEVPLKETYVRVKGPAVKGSKGKKTVDLMFGYCGTKGRFSLELDDQEVKETREVTAALKLSL